MDAPDSHVGVGSWGPGVGARILMAPLSSLHAVALGRYEASGGAPS